MLRAAPGFQLLATVTSAPKAAAVSAGGGGAYGSSAGVREVLGGLWAYVQVGA